MTHRQNTITDTWKYRVLPRMVRYTFILFGLFAKPNLCPLTQNSGDATGVRDVDVSLDSSLRMREHITAVDLPCVQ